MPGPARRTADRALLLGAALALLLPAADTFVHLDPTAPPQEKRQLAAAPGAPRSVAAVQAFPHAFDAWLADHVGLRSSMLALEARIKVRVLEQSPSPSVAVLIGRHGWLYYSGEKSLEYMQRSSPFTREQLDAWCRVMEARRVWLESRGIRFLFVLVPNKETVYPEYLPRWVRVPARPSRADQLVEALKSRTGVVTVDLRPVLIRARRDEDSFLRTDSHWSDFGAYAAYTAVMQQLGEWFPVGSARPVSELRRGEAESSGDLAAMLFATSYLRERRVYLRQAEPYLARSSPAPEYNSLRTWIEGMRPRRSECAGGEIAGAFVLRDSFWDSVNLYLGEHFQRGLYLWWDADFPADVIAKEHPTLVILELVERHLSVCTPRNPPLPR